MRRARNQCWLRERAQGAAHRIVFRVSLATHSNTSAQENRLKDTAITLKVIAFAMTNGMAPHVDKRSTESQINILNQGYLPVGLFFVVRLHDKLSLFLSRSVLISILTNDLHVASNDNHQRRQTMEQESCSREWTRIEFQRKNNAKQNRKNNLYPYFNKFQQSAMSQRCRRQR